MMHEQVSEVGQVKLANQHLVLGRRKLLAYLTLQPIFTRGKCAFRQSLRAHFPSQVVKVSNHVQ